jgi:outer membrane protein assembly factor BamB
MKRLFAQLILSLCLTIAPLFAGEHWPQFRGPNGDGLSDAKGLPLNWSETSHVKWKTPITGKAWSSPVIWGDQIWLTTAPEEGTRLSAICVNRDTGKIEHNLKLFDVVLPQYVHPFNSYASPTPVLEEGRVYVTFGSPGTACIDTKTGKVLWQRRDFVCNHFRGAGSSPILFGDLLIMNFDGSDHQFVVALDKNTGKTIWRQDRSVDYKDLGPDGKPQAEGDFRKAFSTPHLAVLDGQPMLISQGAKAHYGYDPLTGKELWRVEERTTHSASSRPVVGHGLIFLPTGWSNGQLLAIRPDRHGQSIDANVIEPTNSKGEGHSAGLELVWKSKRSISRKPGLLLVGDLIFMLEDGGVASCLEAKTGNQIWQERIGGNYSASPVGAEGRIYFFSEDGKTTVIEASRQFKVLATNQLPDGFMASPAISGKALFLRTKTHLYRIEG